MQLRTLGVEEEFLLADLDGVPSPVGEQVVSGTTDRATSRSQPAEGIEHELQQEQAETGTRVRVELAELHGDLMERRRTLATSAHAQDAVIVAVGTSPVAVQPTVTEDARYLHMMDAYGAAAWERLTCGCHVHVGIDSRAQGVAVINAVQPWLSVILALSSNSPFWQGQDTGYASYRRMVWDRWPGAGPTGPFADDQDYDATVAALVDSHVLLDEAMIYFDARLSAKYPTLEVRVADVCTDPEDAVLVAALCRGLVDTAASSLADPTLSWPRARIELLRGAAWRAARSGLEGELVDPVSGRAWPAPARLQHLVDLVRPSLERHGDLERVETSMHRLLTAGTGAAAQRAAHRRGQSVQAVVLDAAERTVRPHRT